MQKNIYTLWNPGINALDSTFRLCVWNIHKCLSKKLRSDIEKMFQEFDIVILQEAIFSEKWNQVWENFQNFRWDFFRSFSLFWGKETWVLTGSKYRQKVLGILPTVDREPILWTPKASGISLYEINGKSEELLVVNTHAMNFNFGKPFLRQIESVFESIKSHEWPLIWAGDFNTWSKKRLRMLENIARELWLDWIIPENDQRFLKLDHILYRWVRPRYAEIWVAIKTSDHYPIFAEFEFV